MTFPALPSWVELHAMITHFPIALLIVAATAEVISLLAGKWPEASRFFRQTSLLLLGLMFVSSFPAMLTGWLYGRNYRRPPLDYAMHWKMAWVSTVLAGVVLIWRLARRDRIASGARAFATVLLLGATVAVGYTGHLGGNMVFGESGGADDATSAVPAAATTSDNTSERLDLAAEKMEIASERLDVATDRINLALSQERATQAQAAAATAQAAAGAATLAANRAAASAAGAPMPPAVVATSPAADSTDQRLEKVADRYDAVADKLDQVAKQLATQPLPGSGTGWVPLPSMSTVPTGKAGPSAPAGPDPAQVALGNTLFHSDDIGCLSCHKLAGSGGRGGPNLDGEGDKHPDAVWQYQHLMNPKSVTPGSTMPDYDPGDSANADLHLTPEKLKAMAAYLTTLK